MLASTFADDVSHCTVVSYSYPTRTQFRGLLVLVPRARSPTCESGLCSAAWPSVGPSGRAKVPPSSTPFCSKISDEAQCLPHSVALSQHRTRDPRLIPKEEAGQCCLGAFGLQSLLLSHRPCRYKRSTILAVRLSVMRLSGCVPRSPLLPPPTLHLASPSFLSLHIAPS